MVKQENPNLWRIGETSLPLPSLLEGIRFFHSLSSASRASIYAAFVELMITFGSYVKFVSTTSNYSWTYDQKIT